MLASDAVDLADITVEEIEAQAKDAAEDLADAKDEIHRVRAQVAVNRLAALRAAKG